MDSNIVSDPQKQPFIKIRVIICVAAFFINFIFSASKMTLVVSSVSIVHSHTRSQLNSLKNEATNVGLHDKVNRGKNDTESNFKWTQSTVDKFMATVFCGGLFSPIPAGQLADRLGPKRIVLANTLAAGVSMLLFPLAVEWNVNAAFALGFVIGFFVAPGLSCYSGLASRWSPKYEKTIFITTITAGSMVAMILTGPFVGYICSLNYLGGWPLPSYMLGSCNIFIGFLWYLIVTDEPENHPLIKESEKQYILKERSTVKSDSNNPIPWAQMAISGPIWALIFVHFSSGWFSAVVATQVPEYFKSLLKISMSQDGVYAALPYVGSSISLQLFSYCSDKLREKGIFSTTAIRKICADFGFIFGPTFLVMSTLVGHKTKAVITCIVLAKSLAAAQIAGCYGVHLDLAPTYAGLLGGLIDSMHNFSGMVMNQTAFYLVGDHPDLHHWSNLFLVTTAICIIGTHYFALLGSSKLQPWDPTFESEEKAFDDDQNGQLAATTIYDPEIFILDSVSGSMIRKYSRPSLSQ